MAFKASLEIPIITSITNQSLRIVTGALQACSSNTPPQKQGWDIEDMSNSRTASNLLHLSKCLEGAVASQLQTNTDRQKR